MIDIANIKMADIARIAGVSLATVGRVIHQNGYVSEKNRIEIERIIEETGYVPNKIAQGLKSSRSKLIGHMTLLNPNMLYEQIAEAVNRSARKHGYQVLTLTSHRDPEEEKSQVEELIGHQVDGVIITSNSFISKELIEKFIKVRIPVVMIERTQTISQVDCIKVDDFQGAYDAVSRLINSGHKQIGFIGMEPWHEVERLRYEGYCKAIRDAEIVLQKELTYFTKAYSVEEGREGAETLFHENGEMTAIFMTSDIFACGVMQYCYQSNIRVPDRLSLIGYDNTLSSLLAPPITSMGLPCDVIGMHALELLDLRMSDFNREAQSVEIQPVMVNRGTVAKLN
jgi:LacI family transcriptional regulator